MKQDEEDEQKGVSGSIDLCMYALWWGGMGKLCTSDITGIRRLLTLGRIAIRFDDAWIAALAVAACNRRVFFLSIDDYYTIYRLFFACFCFLLSPALSSPPPPPLFFSAPKWRKEGIRWDHKEVYTLFSSDSTTQRTRFVQLKIKFAAAGRHPTKRELGGLHFILYPALIFHARYIAWVQQQSSYSTSLTLPFMYIFLSTIIRLRSVCLSIFCLHLHCVAIYIDLVYM